jgi:hypothetical protein
LPERCADVSPLEGALRGADFNESEKKGGRSVGSVTLWNFEKGCRIMQWLGGVAGDGTADRDGRGGEQNRKVRR